MRCCLRGKRGRGAMQDDCVDGVWTVITTFLGIMILLAGTAMLAGCFSTAWEKAEADCSRIYKQGTTDYGRCVETQASNRRYSRAVAASGDTVVVNNGN